MVRMSLCEAFADESGDYFVRHSRSRELHTAISKRWRGDRRVTVSAGGARVADVHRELTGSPDVTLVSDSTNLPTLEGNVHLTVIDPPPAASGGGGGDSCTCGDLD